MDYSQLEPKKFFTYFKHISDIPRGSGNEAAVLARARQPQASIRSPVSAPAAIALENKPSRPPVVIGCGPAGLFAALSAADNT